MSILNTETGELTGPEVGNYDVHPVAALFPFITGEAFREFVEDIRVNGQREPVVLDESGRLLDGRNRARACQVLGIDVRETRYTGDDAEAWIISHNIHRRHLTESQRAMVAAKLANLRKGGRDGSRTDPPIGGSPDAPVSKVATADAAKALNVSPRSVDRARQIRDHGTPELQADVETGALTVNKAEEIIRAANKQPEKVAEIHAAVKAGKPLPAAKADNRPKAPPKYGGNRRKHLQVIEALVSNVAALAIAAREITDLDHTVTAGEAARLTDDLSKEIKALTDLNKLLKERTK